MINASDRAAQISQQLVMLVFSPEIVYKAHALQALDSKQVPEYVLERFHLAFESLERLRCGARTGESGSAFKHPAFEAFFLFSWRQIRDGEKVLRFEVRSLPQELLAAFFIDEAGNRVWE